MELNNVNTIPSKQIFQINRINRNQYMLWIRITILLSLFTLYNCTPCPCNNSQFILSYPLNTNRETCSDCFIGCYISFLQYIDYQIMPSPLTTSLWPIYQCLSCPADCLQCSSYSGICIRCSLDSYLVYSNNTCQLCNITYGSQCLACNSTKCSGCTNPYVLDFWTPNSVCVACNAYKCDVCIDGPKCQICDDGYFLNINISLCMPCHFPCLTCNLTGTTCLSCNATSMKYYFDNTTHTCPLCYRRISNCTNCTLDGTICLVCTPDFFYLNINSTSCIACSPPCLKCLNASYCLSCIDFNYTLNIITGQCLLCTIPIPNCKQCITSSVCLTCDNTTNITYFLNYPPNACVICQILYPHCLNCIQVVGVGPQCDTCDMGYFVDNGACTHCPIVCSACTSLLVCTSCVSIQYVIQSSMCVPCYTVEPNCLQCTDSTGVMCTKCINLTVVSTALDGTCMTCASTQYSDQIAQICYACVLPCVTCTSLSNCLSCTTYYQFVPLTMQCRDFCGDTVIITYQCDNGIGILNDGCTDKCIKQSNYTCVVAPGTLFNGSTVNQSICSYDLNVQVNLLSIEKTSFANQLTWTYSVKPYLYGLPGTTSRSYNFEELRKTFVFYDVIYGPVASSYVPVGLGNAAGISIQSIQFDASSSQVIIKFSYQQQIKYNSYELFVNFTYLRSVLNIPNFSTTLDSTHLMLVSTYLSNSLIGRYYTQQQYAQAKLIYNIGLAVAILSFLAFVIGIFSKQLVGLEMAMLCQFAYISLFYYKGTLQLPLFALKSLLYSTGFNIPWADKFYPLLSSNPPQARSLQFDSMTLVNNFNLMSIFYILPLFIMVPFIPLKAKCVRKLSFIEMGHKWVDLLMGEILLSIVLFNYQYFMLNLITYYRDGRNTSNYSSTMIAFIGGIISLVSFLGIVFKPQIYGNFRTAFRYNMELRKQAFQEKQKILNFQDNITSKFQGQKTCSGCKSIYRCLILFINENYFWRRWRSIHTILTYNHYNILIIYFTISTFALIMIQNSQIIIISLSFLVMIQLILFRPYGQISQKLRSIYFFLIFTMIETIRYINNNILKSQYNTMLPYIILILLTTAIIWTYAALISYFINLFRHEMSNRNIVVQKVFNNEVENNLDKEAVAEQQEALMRKLMKRYQRIQLQYNLNDARNQLLTGQNPSNDSSRNLLVDGNGQMQLTKLRSSQLEQSIQLKLQDKNKIQNSLAIQILKEAEQKKNFKDIKDKIQKQKKKRKKAEMKNKVTGQKLLKLLKLDNFNKYQNQFLMDDQTKRKLQQQKMRQKQLLKQAQQIYKQNQDDNDQVQQKIEKDKQINEEQSQKSQNDYKDNYESVEPNNLQQAQAKIQEQKILIEEEQHIRYKRAMKIITKEGLELDEELIRQNYHKI